MANFVLLEGPEGNRFFTSYKDGDAVWEGYKVLGYAETVEEAQDTLYGAKLMAYLRSHSKDGRV